MSLARRVRGLLLEPGRAWAEIRAEDPGWRRTLVRHALPLSLLPAVGWSAGQAEGGALGMAAAAAGSVAMILASLLLLAGAVHLIAPAYGVTRNWNRAFSVAAYGSTPVMVAGILFVFPVLLAAGVLAMMQCLYLYYAGLQTVLGCREGDAAEYTAIAFLAASFANGLVGAAGGALGIL